MDPQTISLMSKLREVCVWSTVMLTFGSIDTNIILHLGVCLMLLASRCTIQLMYANSFCLRVAHLYQWLYFYICVIKSKTYMKQEGVPLNTDIYWRSSDIVNCYSHVMTHMLMIIDHSKGYEQCWGVNYIERQTLPEVRHLLLLAFCKAHMFTCRVAWKVSQS